MPPSMFSTVAYLQLPEAQDDASDLTRLLTTLRRLEVPVFTRPLVPTMSMGWHGLTVPTATPLGAEATTIPACSDHSAGDGPHRTLNGITIPILDDILRPLAARQQPGAQARELLEILHSGVADVFALHEQRRLAELDSGVPIAIPLVERKAKPLDIAADGRKQCIQSALTPASSTNVLLDMLSAGREIVHATRDDASCASGLPSPGTRPTGYWDVLMMNAKAKTARNRAARAGKQVEVLPPSQQTESCDSYRPTVADCYFAGSIKMNEVYFRSEDTLRSPATTDGSEAVSAACYEAPRSEPMCLCGCMDLPTIEERERDLEALRAYYKKQQCGRGESSEDESPPSSSGYIEVGFPMRELGPFTTVAPFGGETGDWAENESAYFHLPQSLVDELEVI
ncbi:hypothetical protein C8R46DRAFT_439857 [Mycena filopes]|nr:hypothetical protein C8R46DRAFT_439857 [Mycena filopes]